MPAAPARLLDRLRSVLAPAVDLPDGPLVTRFVADRDDAAFAELVRRHGPMVLAVCRRVVGDAHLAEDAFQATFLVLARRAGAVRPRAAVGAFLHGVAVRTALEARTMIARRRQREAPAPADSSVADPCPGSAETFRALDDEIARLPEHLRSAVVLVELEGRPRKDVAEQLGIPEGTLSSRLAKARKVLADRLRRRGFTLPATLVTAAAVPPDLAAAVSGSISVSPTVARLAGGVFRAMLLKKLPGATAVLAVVCAAVGWSAAGPAERPVNRSPVLTARRTAPVPKPVPREGVILVTSFAEGKPAELFKPDGTPIREPRFGSADLPWRALLSPDGKRVAVLNSHRQFPKDAVIRVGQLPALNSWARGSLHVFDLDSEAGSAGPAGPVLDDLYTARATWAPDGTKLYGSEIDPRKVDDPVKDGQPFPLVSWVYDLTTKAKTPLALPAGHTIMDVSPDGRTLLTVTPVWGESTPTGTYLVPVATLRPERLTGGPFRGMRFSPDGKRVLGCRARKMVAGQPVAHDLVVINRADRSEEKVKVPDEVATVSDACWSPDGRRIAYVWQEGVVGPKGAPRPVPVGGPVGFYAPRINTADPDGANPKTIVRREHNQSITGIDWR